VLHLGERECTLQRRHQKVIEEAPSPVVDEQTRALLGAAACAAAASVEYVGAGTVEFLVPGSDPRDFSFIEMNTRLQVEHPVTELVTGLDLVEQQLRIAAGEPLGLTQDEVRLHGHAIEARVYAEAPHRGFLPSTGDVLLWRAPPGVRTDSGIETGSRVSSDYDPMIAKVIAHAPTREQASARLDDALLDAVVLGIETNIGFLRAVLADPRVASGDLDTGLLADIAVPPPAVPTPEMLAAVAHLATAGPSGAPGPWTRAAGWRAGAPARAAAPALFAVDGVDGEFAAGARASTSAVVAREDPAHIWVADHGLVARVRTVSRRERTLAGLGSAEGETGHSLAAPLPGTVVAVHVEDGSAVVAGQRIATIEAMKMEHALTAPHDGVVHLHVRVGDSVSRDGVVADILTTDATERTT
jgi:acetyl-CoA/propionyl-CoA carboxylase, biotin carboxylase, biotin carboxyl carrier protein